MSWQRQTERRDPAKVLERRQEPAPIRSCAGCKHIQWLTSRFDGRRTLQCAEGLQIGQRCKLFEERGRE